jgi:hypothetical protein
MKNALFTILTSALFMISMPVAAHEGVGVPHYHPHAEGLLIDVMILFIFITGLFLLVGYLWPKRKKVS